MGGRTPAIVILARTYRHNSPTFPKYKEKCKTVFFNTSARDLIVQTTGFRKIFKKTRQRSGASTRTNRL